MDAAKVKDLATRLEWYRDGIKQLERAEGIAQVRVELFKGAGNESFQIKHLVINEELESLYSEEFDSLKDQLLTRLKCKAQYIEQDIENEVDPGRSELDS